jgi:hypothetical protein
MADENRGWFRGCARKKGALRAERVQKFLERQRHRGTKNQFQTREDGEIHLSAFSQCPPCLLCSTRRRRAAKVARFRAHEDRRKSISVFTRWNARAALFAAIRVHQ